MTVRPKPHYSFDAYLDTERAESDLRHEYLDGEVFAMTGATESHNIIVMNISGELRIQMKGRPCFVYTNDMRVRIEGADAGKYPDVAAICGERLFYDQRRDVLLNPSLIVEVLSESTEAYDRGEKFAVYRRLPSLREYLLISQRRMRAELFVRQGDGGWLLTEYSDPMESVPLASIDCRLSLAEVYDKVEFQSD